VCWPFRDRGGLAAVARAFVAEGLERDERVAYVGQGRPCELRQDLAGIANLEDCRDRGQLQVTDIAAMPASDPLTDPVDELIDLAVMTRDSRRGWEARMAELLLGGRRTGRDQTVQDPDPGNAFPGGAIYLSLPGLGDRLAARVAGEIGEHIDQFDSPNALQCYAGRAPVTRRSGKSDFVVARRLAHNRYLGDAVHQWAFCSLRLSGWAREFYDQKIAAGKSHHAALRALGNRWLEILWHCLTKGVLFDEAVHVANRNRAPRTSCLRRG
jgi:hypothetical protein